MQDEKNIKMIQAEINKKNSSKPYYTDYTIYSVINDHDEFPYNRFFRGDVTSHEPKVYERTAGWVPKKMKNVQPPIKIAKQNNCFQGACSIVYPFYATESNNYYYLNKACINEKR